MKRGLMIWALATVLVACGGGSKSNSPTSARAATSTFAFKGAIAVPGSDCPAVTGQTQRWCATNWPPDNRGVVYQYAFTETRIGNGKSRGRTAYVYKPAVIAAGAAYPLLTYLHGGTQSGEELFSLTPFAELADGRSADVAIEWMQNTADCQQSALGSKVFGLGGTTTSGFVSTSDGSSACVPARQSFSLPSGATSFYVVYPNGLTDYSGGGSSWEDGRNPSPGQYDNPAVDDDLEVRDDVAFIDTLIAQIKTSEGALIDASRVYVGGISNGGIMTTRLMCNIGNSNFPELGRVAAFAVSVASMADDIRTGARDRELCPASGNTLAPLAIFVGYDSPTPNSNGAPFVSNCNPYNPSDPLFPDQPACPYPTVSGDGTVPYGTAYEVGGGVFTVNSPTIGNVIASLDNQNFWRDYFSSSGAGASSVATGRFGYFSNYKHYSFADSPLVYQVYEVQGGLHLNGGARSDYSGAARIYDFLFGFKKADGAVSVIGGAYDPATGEYGNLTGIW